MTRAAFCVVFYFYYLLSKIIVVRRKKASSAKGVLYLAAFFPENAGYHWRVKKWAEELELAGAKVTINTAISKSEFYTLMEKNFNLFLIKFLHRRFWQIVNSSSYKTVIVRRELLLYNDYGNLFLEKLLLKIHPDAILDFDDDIAASKEQPKEIKNWYGKLMMEDGNKFNNTLKLYRNFIVASNYLKDKVASVNGRVSSDRILVIPTCVDYDRYAAKAYPAKLQQYTLGWIGGDHNYFLLDIVLPVLNKLSRRFSFRLLVIGGSPFNKKSDFPIDFIKWDLNTEIESLLKVDIGLMPLNGDDVSKGKGGLKLIQYMGLGIVSVASPVTINSEIVEQGTNSFLASGPDEWEKILAQLMSNEINFTEIGLKARKRIMEGFTFTANREKYLSFIEKAGAVS